METKSTAQMETERRRAEREKRLQEAAQRQQRSNQEIYGQGSMLGGNANRKLGRTYDIDVSSFDPEKNKMGTDERIQNDGIDKFEEENAGVEFNGSVLICIKGSPYWIDIPYDESTGPYDGTGDANFPITT